MAVVDIGILVTAVNNATGVLRGVRSEVEGVGFAAQASANRLKAIQVVIAGIVVDKLYNLSKATLDNVKTSEALQTQLGILIGDLRRAGEIVDELNQKYDKLGVAGDALSKVYVNLRQIGQTDTDARKLVDTIALLSAASDRSEAGVSALGLTLTKMLSKGYVDTKAFVNQFIAEFPLAASIVAKNMGAISVEQLSDWAKMGKVSAEKFIAALNTGVQSRLSSVFSITENQLSAGMNQLGSVFRDFINKLVRDDDLSATLSVRLKKVADAIENILNNIDEEKINTFFDTLDTGASVVSNLAGGFYKLAKGISDFMNELPEMTGFIKKQISELNNPYVAAEGIIGYLLFGAAGAAGAVYSLTGILALIREAKQLQSGIGGGGVLPSGEGFGVAVIPQTQQWAVAAGQVGKAMKEVNKEYDTSAKVQDLIVRKAREAGLTIEQIAAMLAHANRESAAFTQFVGDKGTSFGPFQLHIGGEWEKFEKWAKDNTKNVYDFNAQIEFTIQRFKELGGASTKTAEQASQVMTSFERYKGFNDPYSTETEKRINLSKRYVRQLHEQGEAQKIAGEAGAPTGGRDEGFLDSQKKAFDDLKTTIESTKKEAQALIDVESRDTPNRMANERTAQYAQAAANLEKQLNALQEIRTKLDPGQVKAIAQVEEQIASLQGVQNKLLGEQNVKRDDAISKAKTLGQLLIQQQLAEQGILQLKAREAMFTLQTQYNYSALYNILAGTSGGQIAIQTEQQRLQLMQQIAETERQIIQLKQQYLTADESVRASIQQTIALHSQLSAKAKEALANLSAEGMAQRQLWQSVGQSLENGLVQGLSAVITRTGSWKDATMAAYNAITQAAIKYLLQLIQIKMIMPFLSGMGMGGNFGGFLGGLFAANGAVVPGGVRMFASGGIIGGPTLFGMAGEAGKEAIMPLETVNGKLGVRSIGEGGDTIHINLSAIDTQSGIEFLLSHIPTIQAGLTHRKSINRGQRLGSGLP